MGCCAPEGGGQCDFDIKKQPMLLNAVRYESSYEYQVILHENLRLAESLYENIGLTSDGGA